MRFFLFAKILFFVNLEYYILKSQSHIRVNFIDFNCYFHDDDDNELLLWYFDQRKWFSLISNRGHGQRFSPSRISDTPRAGFEPAQNLSPGFVEWSCAVVITTTSRRRNCFKIINLKLSLSVNKVFYILPPSHTSRHATARMKWDVIISSSLRLLLKGWIWYRCQNRVENYYHHDGEQLTFCKKVHNETQT